MAKKPHTIRLREHEHIVAVVAERCGGPGWSNHLYWVYTRDGATGKLGCHAIQPDEMTPALATLFSVHVASCAAVMSEVNTLVKRKKEAANG